MLVISRKVGQRILISDYIVVKVLDIKGNQVRIGIEAPSSIIVDREEAYESKKTKKIQQIEIELH